MEFSMISPDRNGPSNRSRTWMLVAASVAAIALVAGLIVVANRNSDEAPANQPTVTVADTAGVNGETAPAPDTEQSDAQDPAPEAADPEATPDPVVEQATEAAPTTTVASSVATAGVLDGIGGSRASPTYATIFRSPISSARGTCSCWTAGPSSPPCLSGSLHLRRRCGDLLRQRDR